MKIKSLIKGAAFAISGLLSTVLGIVSFCLEDGLYESSITYGGDAYTGIQNAAAQTANNLIYIGDICKFGFGSVLLVAGLVLIVSAVLCFIPDEKSGGIKNQVYVTETSFPAQSAPESPAPAAPESSSFSSVPEQAAVNEPQPKAEPKPGRYCTNCNKNYTDDCDFCPDCGAKLG